MADRIVPFDLEAARRRFAEAEPFPHIVFDHFLAEGFARRLSAAYPGFDEALTWGKSYAAAHENRKIQITESARFPDAVRELHEMLASDEFLAMMSELTGIPSLLADPSLKGGGMHITSAGGWLDVHVDFNLVKETGLHRRLNILVFLNDSWSEEWGGELELWESDVKKRGHALAPLLNRCVVFETTSKSYHGVCEVLKGADDRKSFAAYYYTEEPPAGWDGQRHSTIFRVRPGERFRRTGTSLRAWFQRTARRVAKRN